MANVTVQKIEKTEASGLPIFEEMEKRFEGVRRRAFELFEKRGRALGYALDDWLHAEHEGCGWPAAELDEKTEEYELQMTLPGFDPEEVQVTATRSEILVHAELKPEKAEEAKVVWTEFGPNNIYTGSSKCRSRSMWRRFAPGSTKACSTSLPRKRQRPRQPRSRLQRLDRFRCGHSRARKKLAELRSGFRTESICCS